MSEIKILFIDDEKQIRDSFKRSLKRDNYELHFAKNGKEGLEVMKMVKPTLILLDLKMPVMNGYEFLDKVNLKKTDPHSIIVLSGQGNEEDIKKCYEAGVTAFLHKPIKIYELRSIIKNTLSFLDYKMNLEEEVEKKSNILIQAHHKLQESNEEKLCLLKYLSHEINTPLNWISISQLMAKEEFNEKHNEILDIIEKGYERIKKLSHAILVYADFSDQVLQLDKTPIGVYNLASSILQKQRGINRRLQEKELTIKNEIPEDLTIMADSMYFSEVLYIIIENAIIFTVSKGNITLSAEIEESFMELIISDNGKGIKTDNLKNIFKPFAVNDYDRHESGYGLNLPRAKRITDAHHWDFYAESEGIDKGAKFIIKIPK